MTKYWKSDGIRKLPFGKHHSNNFYWQELSMDAKCGGQRCGEWDIGLDLRTEVSHQDTY